MAEAENRSRMICREKKLKASGSKTGESHTCVDTKKVQNLSFYYVLEAPSPTKKITGKGYEIQD